MIKVYNNRIGMFNSYLFHYAHFMCDCVFPEFVMKFYKNQKKIIRKKCIKQSIGNFKKIYEHIFKIKNEEWHEDNYKNLKLPRIVIIRKENISKSDFYRFQQFIWNRFNIINISNSQKIIFPKILLIQRGRKSNLLSHIHCENPKILLNGNQRREIDDIEKLKINLKKIYGNLFDCIILEENPFSKQVLYFYNANIIIAAHGAGLSNIFFCKPKTKIIEITCGGKWIFFDKISSTLGLVHLKIYENKFTTILDFIKKNNL